MTNDQQKLDLLLNKMKVMTLPIKIGKCIKMLLLRLSGVTFETLFEGGFNLLYYNQ